MVKPKIILDIAEKAFPKASEKVKNLFKKTYDDMRIDMSEDSAFEAAKKETREKIKIEPKTKVKGGSINKMFVGGIPDPSTIVSKLSAASPQDYIDYKTNTGIQASAEPEERTGYKATEFKTTVEEKPTEKSKGGMIYTKPHQKKYYGDLI
jgi:hypothetical protein